MRQEMRVCLPQFVEIGLTCARGSEAKLDQFFNSFVGVSLGTSGPVSLIKPRELCQVLYHEVEISRSLRLALGSGQVFRCHAPHLQTCPYRILCLRAPAWS